MKTPINSGWQTNVSIFNQTDLGDIQKSIESYLPDSSESQASAWRESIRILQREFNGLIANDSGAEDFNIILEYKLPYDGRRPDAIILAKGLVFVLEFKGKETPDLADLDQVSAYARDLKAYHRECHDKRVIPVLVPTRASHKAVERTEIQVVGPKHLSELLSQLLDENSGSTMPLESFISENAYAPLPTLVEAARELFESQTIREIWSAKAATDPAVESISSIVKRAAETKTRHLVLITGVPGAGKTLVGMQAAHDEDIDQYSVPREGSKPTVSGLYLTGNGPLAQVLQYEFQKAGGGGATFVRHIKEYLNYYIPNPDRIPSEHLLVFDEAQRAFSPDRVEDIHPNWRADLIHSEPELFTQTCDRIPEWSVLVGLIGQGQEIYIGEEAGLIQWREALENSEDPSRWTIHAPSALQDIFEGSIVSNSWNEALNLSIEIRFHQSKYLHEFVHELLINNNPDVTSKIAEKIQAPQGHQIDGMRMYLTRDLNKAKQYLVERYANAPEARYGIISSSRDKALVKLGVTSSRFPSYLLGQWFCDAAENPKSCRNFNDSITEFDCQGLELEMAIVGWGTDFIRENNQWTDRLAKGYRPKGITKPKNPFQMRVNAYRVLLTRGRDGLIVYIPSELEELNETYKYLLKSGFTLMT